MDTRSEGVAAGLSEARIEAFIARWAGVTGTKQSNAQMFVYELRQELGLLSWRGDAVAI